MGKVKIVKALVVAQSGEKRTVKPVNKVIDVKDLEVFRAEIKETPNDKIFLTYDEVEQ